MTDKPTIWQRTKNVARNALDTLRGSLGFDLTATFEVPELNGGIELPVDMDGDTIWATQLQMAELFGVDRSVIRKHIKNVFDSGELEQSETTWAKIAQVRSEGDREVVREVDHYSLDVILAVGYRVSGKRATAFRKWATGVLRGYIEKGYALNGERLRVDPQALLDAARAIRAIRTEEKTLYGQVRAVFKEAAIDYDPKARETRDFFAEAQNIWHYAATDATATELVISRADAARPNMGLVGIGNQRPNQKQAQTAKNYLTETELRRLQVIGEQFLLYAEGVALRGKKVSMQRLLQKLRELAAINEWPVLPEGAYKTRPSRDVANAHAAAELAKFKALSAPDATT